jgi:hypothetical protein
MKKTLIIISIFVPFLIVILSGCAAPYEKGVIAGNVYENKSLHLKFTAPDGYEIESNENFEVKARQTEMNVQVGIFIVQNPLISIVTTEDYIKGLQDELSKATNMRYIFAAPDETPVEIAGQNYYLLSATLQNPDGVTVYQDYYVRKHGSRFVGIIITCGDMDIHYDQTKLLLNSFTAI